VNVLNIRVIYYYREWVKRCFASLPSDSEKDVMEKQLRDVIANAFARDAVNSTDWNTYPIPQIMSV